ncbi:MAG: hypothetical protein HY590_04305 [Candidatus Omnitrophica bacterium]|nr:hypothetical protein [Candidatus Omnitrophota bacterium]
MITALGHVLLFSGMNAMVAATTFTLAKSLFSLKGGRDLLLASFLLYLAEIFTVELFWSTWNRMRLLPILGTVSLLFLVTILFGRRKAESSISKEFQECLGWITRNRILLFTASVLLGFLVTKVIYNLRYPPLGWDSIGYHLVFPVEWLKRGRIWFYQVVFSDPSPSYYPFMGGLYYFWLLLPFRNAFMADLGQLPFYLALLLATYGFSRRIGLDREISLYGAFLFGLIPNVLKQVEISYVDLIIASYFMSALYFLSLLSREWNFSHLFFVSLASGLLIGTKTHGLLWFALLCPYFLGVAVKHFRRKGETFLLYGATLLGVILLFGGLSYIRNYLLTQNITYPISLQIGPYLAKGIISYADYRYNAHGAFRWEEFYFHNGLGVQLLLLITPGLFLALWMEFWKKKADLERVYWVSLPFLIFLVFLFVNPFPGNERYIYHGLALGCVVALSVFDRLFPKKVVRIFVLVCVLGSAAELAGHWELFFSLLGVGLFVGWGEMYRRGFLSRRLSKWPVVSLCSILGIAALIFLEILYRQNEFNLYPRSQFSNYDTRLAEAWKWVNEHTSLTGSKVAYAGSCLPFPLYGTGLKNDVSYVTVNGIPPNLHLCDGDYRRGARYETWERMLLEGKIDLLIVYDMVYRRNLPPFNPRRVGVEEYPIGVFPLEDEWARNHPERLKPVFQNERVHIYTVQKEGLT